MQLSGTLAAKQISWLFNARCSNCFIRRSAYNLYCLQMCLKKLLHDANESTDSSNKDTFSYSRAVLSSKKQTMCCFHSDGNSAVWKDIYISKRPCFKTPTFYCRFTIIIFWNKHSSLSFYYYHNNLRIANKQTTTPESLRLKIKLVSSTAHHDDSKLLFVKRTCSPATKSSLNSIETDWLFMPTT